MEVEHGGGSEPEEEDWEEVGEVRRGSMCYRCWMMLHFARCCRRKDRGKGERDTSKEKGKR